MSMTKEEAIKYGENKLTLLRALGYNNYYAPGEYIGYYDEFSFVTAALSALRPITREQVEKMRGEWIIEDAGDGDRRKKCSLCNQPISGWWGRDRFCANCGSPMTDEAVDMVMERLEALRGETKTD